MYKKLLDKGFKSVYYTNKDFLENRDLKSRLVYRYNVESKELLSVIFNVLNNFDKYYYLLLNEDLIVKIEIEENLESFWVYLYNTNTDNFELSIDEMNRVLDILPNLFKFEHHED